MVCENNTIRDVRPTIVLAAVPTDISRFLRTLSMTASIAGWDFDRFGEFVQKLFEAKTCGAFSAVINDHFNILLPEDQL